MWSEPEVWNLKSATISWTTAQVNDHLVKRPKMLLNVKHFSVWSLTYVIAFNWFASRGNMHSSLLPSAAVRNKSHRTTCCWLTLTWFATLTYTSHSSVKQETDNHCTMRPWIGLLVHLEYPHTFREKMVILKTQRRRSSWSSYYFKVWRTFSHY